VLLDNNDRLEFKASEDTSYWSYIGDLRFVTNQKNWLSNHEILKLNRNA
jgi:hypothetical protein